MKRKESLTPLFLIFIFLSISLLFLAKIGFLNYFEDTLGKILLPLQKTTKQFFGFPQNIFSNTEIRTLKNENMELLKKLVNQSELKKENNALRDQFQTSVISSGSLIPATVIGMPTFFPGLTNVEYLLIDKGSRDGIKVGQAVIFKDYAIGKIVKVSSRFSRVNLLTSKELYITAKTMETNALGIVKGQGDGEIVLDNVLLSENLKVNDIVLTKGDINLDGIGFVQHLIVGTIKSIEKKPSALFQKASIKSPIDFSKLSTVFVIFGP